MVARYVVKKGRNGFRFTLESADGDVLVTSERFPTEAEALGAVRAVRTLAPVAVAEDAKGTLLEDPQAGGEDLELEVGDEELDLEAAGEEDVEAAGEEDLGLEPAAEEEEDLDAGGEEEPLPIEGYDDLLAFHVLPLLEDLTVDELEMVADYEESTRNRDVVLDRIDDLLADREDEGLEPAAPHGPLTPADEEDEFPIEGYDGLTVAQVLPLLEDLDGEELEMVAEREEAGKNRRTILKRVDAMLAEAGEDEAPSADGDVATESPEAPGSWRGGQVRRSWSRPNLL